MGRYTGPKDRLSRRENFDIFSAGLKIPRLTQTPGLHGPKGQTRKVSQYGKQLREKQKVKRIYGVNEKQFQTYIEKAFKTVGNTSDALFSLLERRLDNTIYRLGFAPSRPAARQMVSHRHVLVDGKKVNIPSYQVRVGEVITFTPKTLTMPIVKAMIEKEVTGLPEWLERKAAAGKITRKPVRDDVKEPISDQDIVEYYSR